jgi:3-oxoacyl-[acyl-carrier-protein] synthase II
VSAGLYLTGAGLLSPSGGDLETVWSRLLEGRAAWSPGPALNGNGRRHELSARIEDAAIDERLPARAFRRLPRYSKLFLAAAASCLRDLGGEGLPAGVRPERVGVFLGTSRGPLEAVESISFDLLDGRARHVNAVQFQETVYNAPLGHLSIHYGITGPCIAMSSGGASGLLALEMAVSSLRAGRLDLALVGGVDSLTETYRRGMSDAGVLSPARGGSEQMAPFAADRNGTLAAEGGVFLAIETAASAERRGARRDLELLSAVSVSDGASFYANDPEGRGFRRALRTCLREAELSPAAVDLILASATGERQLDRAEWRGIAEVWGGDPSSVLVTSFKGLLGDMGAANALLSVALCHRIFERGMVPGAPSAARLDPECPLRVAAASQPASPRTILVNEASWGGINASAAVRRA